MWNLAEAIVLLKDLQIAIEPAGYHVGLLGSVLRNGFSKKDLDVVIFPLRKGSENLPDLYDRLKLFGMRQMIPKDAVHKIWRDKFASTDTKHVEVWKWGHFRVDLFFMS